MNIVIDVRALMGGKWSGVETYIHYLIKSITALDKSNNYILFANASRSQTKHIPNFGTPNIQIIQTRIPNKVLNFGLLFFNYPKLDKLLEKKLHKKIDAFVFPDLRPYALSRKTAAIQTVHDLCFEHFSQFFSKKSRLWFKILRPKKLIKKADVIIAVSLSTKNDVVQTYKISPQKIHVIYEGIDQLFGQNLNENTWKNLKKKYQLPDEYFLFLSTLEPRKNLKNLLLAFEEYKKENTNKTKLVLVGQEQPDVFSKLQIPSTNDVIQTGFIHEEEKSYFYKNAKALVYPSFFEGFGLPLLEAIKCQTPVITSDRSSMPEIAQKCALYVNPEDTNSIKNALKQIDNEQVRKELKKSMADQIKKFNWEECAASTLQLITEAVQNKNPL